MSKVKKIFEAIFITLLVIVFTICIGCISDVINLFKPTQPTTEELKT